MEQLIEQIGNIVVILTTIVGAASMILAGLRKIANITPTTVDDEWVSKAEKALAFAVKLLDRLALNPDQSAARKSNDDLSKAD